MDSIFITGASSGIGYASAQRLYVAGYHVIAGVLPGESTTALQALGDERLTIVPLDITDSLMIAKARERVETLTGDRGLYGVLNNAGVAISGPIEFTPMAAIRHQLDVNLMGQIEVTQAMLAMIRKRRGRIVNVVSILGRIAVAFSAPYCMSKFAMEAFTDSLRLEMKAFGVHVSAIEPGVIKTPIWSKTRETTQEIIDELPPEGQQLYGGDLATFLETVQREGASGIPAGAVAEAVIHAFTAKVPRTRYLVGDDARQVARLRRLLGDRLLDRLLQWRYPTGQK